MNKFKTNLDRIREPSVEKSKKAVNFEDLRSQLHVVPERNVNIAVLRYQSTLSLKEKTQK